MTYQPFFFDGDVAITNENALHLPLADDSVDLVVTSDHGNLEDIASGHHTLNPVPLLAAGPGAAEFAAAGSLLDVAPGVRRVWERQGIKPGRG